jgi:hypothetical protein
VGGVEFQLHFPLPRHETEHTRPALSQRHEMSAGIKAQINLCPLSEMEHEHGRSKIVTVLVYGISVLVLRC